MEELVRLWALEAGYREWAYGAGDRTRAAVGNGTLRDVLRRIPGRRKRRYSGGSGAIKVVERIAWEDQEKCPPTEVHPPDPSCSQPS